MSLLWPWRKRRKLFVLEPKWKEMMFVAGPGGSFTLDFWMGIPTVSLPSEKRWRDVAPDWAAGLWHELKAELEDWCANNGAALEVDAKAGVY